MRDYKTIEPSRARDGIGEGRMKKASPALVTGRQIRAARALLGWNRNRLAEAAGLHRNAVAYWERHAEIPMGPYATPFACRCIQAALLTAGVETFDDPSPGVRLCRRDNYDASTHGRARTRVVGS